MLRPILFSCFAGALILGSANLSYAASFMGLGDLPGGQFASMAMAITATVLRMVSGSCVLAFASAVGQFIGLWYRIGVVLGKCEGMRATRKTPRPAGRDSQRGY